MGVAAARSGRVVGGEWWRGRSRVMALCVRDPCGVLCLLLTYLSVSYSEYVILRHILLEDYAGSVWCPLHAVFYNLIVFMLLACHTRAVFSDPGVVPLPEMAIDFSDLRGTPRKNDRGNEDWTVCNRCETYRPPRAHHCRICHRCIRRMDHHCPWINNCVGELNQKYFIQFLFYTALASMYSVGLVLGTWLLPALRGGDVEDAVKVDHVRSHVQIAHCILLLVESVLFGLFVTVIFYDQIVSIITDETPIEQLRNKLLKEARKEVTHSRKPKMALLREVFGRGFIVCWFCPLVTPPSSGGPAYSYLPDYDV